MHTRQRPSPHALLFLSLIIVGTPAALLGCAAQAQTQQQRPVQTHSLSTASTEQASTRTTKNPTKSANQSSPAIWRSGTGNSVVEKQGFDPGKSLAPLVAAISPAVVSIEVRDVRNQEESSNGPSFRGFQGFPHFPGMPMPPPGHDSGMGSGFIISSDGYVVTNHHVVAGRNKISVKLSDGRQFDATLVGSDSQTDIALLQLKKAKNLPTVVFGSSEHIRVGDWVVAIGSPMGLDHTVTRGIVSAKGRGDLGLYSQGYANFLQTDAAISPGNSGGPLFNLQGEVVAINTAISRMGNDLGFAIPIDQAKKILPQLATSGKVARGWLGISGRQIRPAGASTGSSIPKGAQIGNVQRGGPADKGGLRPNDQIIAINGNPIKDFSQLRNAIADLPPQSKVQVEVQRDRKKKSLTITLGEQPSPEELARYGSDLPDADQPRSDGLDSLYGEGRPRLGIRASQQDGRVVVDLIPSSTSIAAQLGLKKGDIIQEVNGVNITRIDQLKAALERDRFRVQVMVKREGQVHTMTLTRR